MLYPTVVGVPGVTATEPNYATHCQVIDIADEDMRLLMAVVSHQGNAGVNPKFHNMSSFGFRRIEFLSVSDA